MKPFKYFIFKTLFYTYLFILILFVAMKYTGSISELLQGAADVRANRAAGNVNANWELFYTIRVYLKYRNLNVIYLRNLLGNIIPFIPMGYFSAVFLPKRKFLLPMFQCFLLILSIEVFQFVTGLGYFDVDDILLNMIGCLLGYWAVRISRHSPLPWAK